jgi:hypothetical protein
MFLLELHHGLLAESFELQAAQHSGWRLVTPCDGDLPQNNRQGKRASYERERVIAMCPFLREASELDEKEWREFLSLFNTVLATAQSGQDWPKVMHKQVHPAGDVSIRRRLGKHERHTIIQFGKKKSLIRIFAFISTGGRKLAFVSHSFEKPANVARTPAAEQERASVNLQSYLDAIDAKNVQLIEAQGGEYEFLKMV